MANLPSQHPHLSLHLTDRALTPLITSARTQPQLEALTSLSHGALSAHESALRLGLGSPQRIVVEHADGGPILLQSFLRADAAPPRPSTNGQPSAAPSELASPSSPTSTAAERRLQQLQLGGAATPTLAEEPDGSGEADANNAPPMFVGLVVAPGSDDARDARRAAARLERVGREIQARWVDAQTAAQEDEGAGDNTGD
ncbi:hypothetical protein F4804DRAFT_329689 [Jackrogersella minutella]|nr:hypothetical protein F4804DRAFT_329689 [Jackrogersella minutella]